MACRSQSVGPHSAVVLRFVGGFPERGQTDDDIAGLDAGIVHYIGAAHAGRYGRIDDDGTHQVAHVGRFPAGGDDVDPVGAHLGQQFLRAADNGCDDFAGDQVFVAPDGGREQDVVRSSYAQQVVDVHYQGVLRDAFPDGKVAGTLPVHVGQGGFGARSVGVHDDAVFRVAGQVVGDDLAESPGEQPFVHVADGVVYVLLRGGNAATGISFAYFHSIVV